MALEHSVESWTFRESDIHFMTHGIHTYPARMIPQVAERLISMYGSKKGLLLDPFCGSGGVLTEALRQDMNAIGLDINPLACLLSRVKSRPIDPEKISDIWQNLKDRITHDITRFRFNQLKPATPNFGGFNIDYWFKPYMISELAILRSHLEKIEDNLIRDFFHVCFSSTVREVSGTRTGEFKLYRMEPEKWEAYNPDVIKVFMQRVNTIMPKVGELFDFVKTNKISAHTEVYNADTRDIFTENFPRDAKKLLKQDSVDLIVTSPPYGDSHTTVAYGQFSRLSLLMLGYPNEQTLEVDKRSIGGRKNGTTIISKTLEEIVGQMHQEVRKREVHDFFVDLSRCMANLSKVLVHDGRACFVLGNRTVNSVQIPADKILIEIGEGVGLVKENVFYREIPNKRIPSKSSPTNIAGKKVNTMSKESIVILKKN